MNQENYIIAVASGKGGTGKTTVSLNLFYSIKDRISGNIQLADCDVEEPNLNLFLQGKEISSEQVGIMVPVIDKERCTYCGRCVNVCNYNAIVIIKNVPDILVMNDLCHGCGACSYFCPTRAITEKLNPMGVIKKYEIGSPPSNYTLIEGKLDVGATIVTPIIRDVKKRLDKTGLTIIDAPPGTSCSVVESIEDADYVVLVTEPTPFGLNDLQLAYKTVEELNKKCGIVINRADLGTDQVKEFAKEKGIDILLEIPFDKRIAELYSRGKIIAAEIKEYKDTFFILYKKILEKIQANTKQWIQL